MGLFITMLVLLIVLVISALPLHFAVKILGGKSTIIKVIVVNVLVSIIIGITNSYFGLIAGFVFFLILIVIYKLLFKMGFIRVILAWLLQSVIALLLIFIAGIFGISLIL